MGVVFIHMHGREWGQVVYCLPQPYTSYNNTFFTPYFHPVHHRGLESVNKSNSPGFIFLLLDILEHKGHDSKRDEKGTVHNALGYS